MPAFNIEILAIGNELCYGKVADTNSFWLADQLTRAGGLVTRITCTRDSEEQICRILEEIIERKVDFLVITGGLGPTNDDRTLDSISKLTKLDTIVDENALEKISKRKNIPKSKLTKNYLKMARKLSGADTINNPIGICPTIVLKLKKTMIIAMPGPPNEVQAIFNNHISKIIENSSGRKSQSTRVIVKMVESEVAPIIEDIEKTIDNVYLKPLVSEYDPEKGIPIEIISFEKNDNNCLKLINKTKKLLRKAVEQKGRKFITSINKEKSCH
ncbi:competence/damage-inducible protein A [[Eubacterium] cellulosolvens]